MRISSVAACVALSLAAAACGSDPDAAGGPAAPAASDRASSPTGELVAVVGTGGVPATTFQSAAGRAGRELDLEGRKELLDELINEEALWLEASRRGLDRDPKVRKIMVNLLLRTEVYEDVKASDFTPEELRAYFDAHTDEFVVPEKVQVKRLFFKVDEERSVDEAMALARKHRATIAANPASFSEVAIKHSEDNYKRRGGDLGFMAREGKAGLDPAVVDVAFGLDVNQVSEPFEAGGGVNVVMAAGRRDRVERTFEQMKGSVMRKLKNERYKVRTEAFVAEVKTDLPIEVDEALLAELEVTRPGQGVLQPREHKAPVEPDAQ